MHEGHHLPIKGLLFLLTGLGGGMGGCLAGAPLAALAVAAALVLARADNAVLGAGVGAVFAMLVAAVAVEDAVLAVLLAGAASLACRSFASWEEDEGLFGGSKGCLGTCGS